MSRSWHGVTGGAASDTYSSSRKGYGPPQPGALVLPAPDTYRSRFIDDRGVVRLAGRARVRLRAGRPPVERRARRLHRRADPELGRRARAARGLHRGAREDVRRARHAADLRRGADRARPHRHSVRLRARRRRAAVSSRCRRRSAPACRSPPMLTTPEIEDVAAERGYLFYTTHASDPLPAAVGLKVIEVILRDRFTERAAELGTAAEGRAGRPAAALRMHRRRARPRPAARPRPGEGPPQPDARPRACPAGGARMPGARHDDVAWCAAASAFSA